jgi:hypothetical protein
MVVPVERVLALGQACVNVCAWVRTYKGVFVCVWCMLRGLFAKAVQGNRPTRDGKLVVYVYTRWRAIMCLPG